MPTLAPGESPRTVLDFKIALARTRAAPSPATPPPTSLEDQERSVVPVPADLWGNSLPAPRPPKPLPLKQQPGYDPTLVSASNFRRACPHAPYGPFDVRPADVCETHFRHQGWSITRDKVSAALRRIMVPPARQERFRHCGSGCVVEVCKVSGRARAVSNHCHDRFCKPCGEQRSRLIAANLERHLAGREARFITLTLRHNSSRLRDQITRLLTCFKRLREEWRGWELTKGGAAFVEVKTSRDGRFWHPHLHIIAEGQFINQKLLSDAWLNVTGDSSIVDIRFVRDPGEVVRYVAKYASKPLDPTIFKAPHLLDEAMLALKGRRLCNTFGSWRGVALEERPEDPGEWVPVATLISLRRAVGAGEAWATALWLQLTGSERLEEPRTPPTGDDG